MKKRMSYSKFLPVVAGYKIDNRIFFLGSMMKTARADTGIPAVSSSCGSNIPSKVTSLRDSSSNIG